MHSDGLEKHHGPHGKANQNILFAEGGTGLKAKLVYGGEQHREARPRIIRCWGSTMTAATRKSTAVLLCRWDAHGPGIKAPGEAACRHHHPPPDTNPALRHRVPHQLPLGLPGCLPRAQLLPAVLLHVQPLPGDRHARELQASCIRAREPQACRVCTRELQACARGLLLPFLCVPPALPPHPALQTRPALLCRPAP